VNEVAVTDHKLQTADAATTEPQQLTVNAVRPPKGSTTDHTIATPAGPLSFRATADWVVLRKLEKPVAEIFHVYYRKLDATRGDAADPARPVTFVFNGGPGAASAYLHVGALGPRRIMFAADGTLLPPPSRLTDNESTWLAFTDLVFIDPVGTGFSRMMTGEPAATAAAGGKPPEAAAKPAVVDGKDKDKEDDEFFKVNRDLESLCEFISKFLSKHRLWSRPVFIAGESYGGFRVGKLARKLQEGFGVGLNGAILISPAMELSLLDGSDYDILMWSDVFPSQVAAAVHHGRSRAIAKGQQPGAFLPEVERFACNGLLRLLTLGEAMPAAERSAIVAQTAAYLGLPEAYVEGRAARIAHAHFARELLRDEKKVVGLYDATITAHDPFPDRDLFEGADPTLFAIDRVFTGGINTMIREQLAVETDLDYHLLSLKVNESWKVDNRKHAFESQLGATDDLRYAMALNPHMKVMINHGYHDMVTPYFSSNRLVGLMKLAPELRRNLTVRHFTGGHMFYAWEESRTAFHATARDFYESAL
jgi:carboxypeptidase C (cathepsin A)